MSLTILLERLLSGYTLSTQTVRREKERRKGGREGEGERKERREGGKDIRSYELIFIECIKCVKYFTYINYFSPQQFKEIFCYYSQVRKFRHRGVKRKIPCFNLFI